MIEHPSEKRKAKKALEVIEWYFAAVPQVSKTIGVVTRKSENDGNCTKLTTELTKRDRLDTYQAVASVPCIGRSTFRRGQ